jgi:uncharacterized protein YndB with AHSA1/START domain
MARYRTSVDSPASAEAVFDYLADFSSAAQWDPGVASAKRLDTGPVGVGSRFEVVVRFGPRRIPLTYELVEYVRPERFVLQAEAPTFSSRDTITVTPTASGSTMTYDADLPLKGPFKLFDKVLGLLFGRIGDNAAAGLRRELGRLGHTVS